MSQWTLLVLLAYIILSHGWFFYQIHTLVNKLTSRGHYEYKLAESLGKPKTEEFKPPKVDESEDEDVSGRVFG